MKHVGDITKLDGTKLEPVWCIVGGSPCQDLSVAGKRKWLAGERSGLFMEQIRVIKEMRSIERTINWADQPVRLPRFAVWENVIGAYSSNSGYDFHAVLEEFVRIAEPTADVPRPAEHNGKLRWEKAGIIIGDGWSVAWRTHDAQYWGVPQRRRRISVVADFGGQCAGEILFEREGLPGNTQPGGETREEAAGGAGNGAEKHDSVVEHDYTLQIRSGCAGGGKGTLVQTDKSATLSCGNTQTLFQRNNGLHCLNPQDYQTKRCYSADGVFPALSAGETSGQNQQSVLTFAIEGNGQRESHKGDGFRETDKMYTLNTTEVHGVAFRQTGFADYAEGCGTLRASGGDLGGGTESIVVTAI